MIPTYDERGNLPAGIHETNWGEFEAFYSFNAHRKKLLNGLRLALNALQKAGCKQVYVGWKLYYFKRTTW